MITKEELNTFYQKYKIKITSCLEKNHLEEIDVSDCDCFKEYYKRRSSTTIIKVFDEAKKWYAYNPLEANCKEQSGWYHYNQKGYGWIKIINSLDTLAEWSLIDIVNQLKDKGEIKWKSLGYKTAYINTVEDLYSYMEINLKRMKAIKELVSDESLLKNIELIKKNQSEIELLTNNNEELKRKIGETLKKKCAINSDMEN